MIQSKTTTRSGLPDYLHKLLKIYPREDWQNHNNFNDLTKFWLSRHAMFRELIHRLQSDTRMIMETNPHDKKQAYSKLTLSRMTDFLLSSLHEHHTIEDHQFFPMLIPFDSDLRKGFDILEADHQALDKNIHNLAQKSNNLLNALQSGKNVLQSAEQVLETQISFEKFLDRHLVDEEELIIPIILEYGGPEFAWEAVTIFYLFA